MRPFATLSSQVITPHHLKQRIAGCILTLTRWGLESHKGKDPRIFSAHQSLQTTLSHPTIHSYLTQKEHSLHALPLGSWDLHKHIFPIQGKWEYLGILLWSLQLWPWIPAYHLDFPKTQLFQSTRIVPARPESILDFVNSTKESMHPLPAIQQELDRAQAWHWRARAQRILEWQQSIQARGNAHEIQK